MGNFTVYHYFSLMKCLTIGIFGNIYQKGMWQIKWKKVKFNHLHFYCEPASWILMRSNPHLELHLRMVDVKFNRDRPPTHWEKMWKESKKNSADPENKSAHKLNENWFKWGTFHKTHLFFVLINKCQQNAVTAWWRARSRITVSQRLVEMLAGR